jgi:hypothetical protein
MLKAEGAKHALERASLFDGTPDEMADLVPDNVDETGANADWAVPPANERDRDYTLVCHYKGTPKTNDIPLPDSVKSCAQITKHARVAVICR